MGGQARYTPGMIDSAAKSGRRPRAPMLPIVLFSAVVVFALYPGWLFYDSATQWDFAKRIVDNGFPLRLSTLYINSQWPIFLTLLKVPFLALTGEVGLYVFCQSVVMLWAIWFFIREAAGRLLGPSTLSLCFWAVALTPFVWGYAVFHSSDTIAALITLPMLAVLAADCLTGRSLATFTACAVVLVLSRFNAAPAGMFLAGALAVVHRADLIRLKRVAALSGAVAAIIVGVTLAYQRTANPVDIVMDGMLLRVWDVEQRVNDPKLSERLNALAVKPVTEPLNADCFDNGTFCPQMRETFDLANLPYNAVTKLYLGTLLRHPIAFAQASARFGYHQLGIPMPLGEDELGWNKEYQPAFERLNQLFDARKAWARDVIHASEWFPWGVPARPAVMIALSLLGAVFILRSGRLTWLCAGFYIFWYGPLMAIAPAFGFRYAFPITLVAYLIICASAAVLISRVIARVKMQIAPRKARAARLRGKSAVEGEAS